jgi:hypothetical protein
MIKFRPSDVLNNDYLVCALDAAAVAPKRSTGPLERDDTTGNVGVHTYVDVSDCVGMPMNSSDVAAQSPPPYDNSEQPLAQGQIL